MMNERILELARQAANGMLSYDAEGNCRLEEKEVEKFAELIVQKCMELCKVQEYDYWRTEEHLFDFTPIDCANAIKEHFGVE